MPLKPIKITETILRDAHQSLIATRMKTSEMLPIAEKLDEVGYFSLEMWGGATFDVCLRFLNEDPWDRLKELRKRIKKTKLQMLLRGQNIVGYRNYPDDVLCKFIELAKRNGIDVFRIFDALNDIRNMEVAIKKAKEVDGIVEGTISYTISPVHTIQQYVKFAKELKQLGCDIICIKDMAGMLAPQDAYELVKALKEEVGLPVHVHCHCCSGMAPITYMRAIEAGADIVDTAISPFAWGTSQPPTESIVGALKNTEYDTGLDLELLNEIADYFKEVKKNYKIDEVAQIIDPKIISHQIPGGMMSNLLSQLKEENALNKLDEVLKETERVRAELGYPPLVTPTSQIVGTQAVLNVVLGERYKMIPKEVKDYIKGLYGRPPGVIDENVKRLAIGDEKIIEKRPADLLEPQLDKAKEEIREFIKKEEDLVSYCLFPEVAKEFFKKKEGKKEIIEREELPPPQVSISESFELIFNNNDYNIKLKQRENNRIVLQVDDEEYNLYIDNINDEEVYIKVNENFYKIKLTEPIKDVRNIKLMVNDEYYTFGIKKVEKEEVKPKVIEKVKTKEIKEGEVIAPMPGKILKIFVKLGDNVNIGDRLAILEAMKMENEIIAPREGKVTRINVKEGDNVNSGDVIIVIE